MKRLKIAFIIFIGVYIAATGAALCVIPRPAFSESEKRALAEFPAFSVSSYLSGDFTAGIAEYYNDTIPGRDYFKDLTGRLHSISGLRLNDAKLYRVKNNQQDEAGSGSGSDGDIAIPEDAGAALPGDGTAGESASSISAETTAELFTEKPDERPDTGTADSSDVSDAPVSDTATEPPVKIKTETAAQTAPEAGKITALLIDKTSLTLNVGEKYTFDVRLRSSGEVDRVVSLTSSKNGIVKISGFTVTGSAKGGVTLTFTASNGMSVTCKVTVTGDYAGADDDIEDYLAEKGIIIIGTRGMCLYGGSYKIALLYAETLKNYYLDLGGKVKVYSMVIPTACEFYCPEQYAAYNSSQLKMINYIRDNLGGDVIFVDAYSQLAAHTGEDIYLRTDHHWAPLGAYYAAKAFADAAGLDYPELSSYKKVVKEGFLGTIYSVYTQDAVLLNNPEDFVYYESDAVLKTTYYDPSGENAYSGDFYVPMYSRGSYYCTFMGSDDKITRVQTQTKNGRKLVIIKESFGNPIPSYLFKSFEEIYVIDLRYFNLNAVDYIKSVGATDLLFATCTFTASGAAGKLDAIRTQNKAD